MFLSELKDEQKDLFLDLGIHLSLSVVREKRFVLLEIAGVVMADEVYSSEEKAEVKKISDALGVDYSHCEDAISLVKDLFVVYSKIGNFLSNK